MVDSDATAEGFINEAFVAKMRILTISLKKAILIQGFNGELLSSRAVTMKCRL